MERKNYKIKEILIRVFNFFCAIFPFGMAMVFAVVYIGGGWEWLMPEHNLAYYKLPELDHVMLAFFLIVCVLISILFIVNELMIFIHSRVKNISVGYAAMVAVIFLMAWITRFLLVYAFREDISPFSDFRRTWDMAHGGMENNLDYYTLFPAYLNYTVYIKKLCDVTGDIFMNIIYVNVFLSATTAIFIYFITHKFFKKEKLAILASLLYVFMPSQIMYTTVATPEFLAIAFNTLGICLLINAVDIHKRFRIPMALLAGVAIGIGSSFKAFGSVIIIAFMMAAFFCRKEIDDIWVALGLLLGYFAAKHAVLCYMKAVLQIEIDASASLPHFLLIGLNTEGEGQISLGTLSRRYYTEYLNNGHNVSAAKTYAYCLLKEDWSKNWTQIVPLFLKKVIWSWQDDMRPVYYFCNRVGIEVDSLVEQIIWKFSQNVLPAFNQLYYFFIMLFGAVGTWFVGRAKEINYKLEFLLLVIFGYFCLMIIVEAQSRYKCLIMPYICIIAAYGISMLREKIRNRIGL